MSGIKMSQIEIIGNRKELDDLTREENPAVQEIADIVMGRKPRKRIIDFCDTKILAEEYEVLQQIYQGATSTPEIQYDQGYIKLENNRIICLDVVLQGITQLPDSIEQLTQLRSLDIGYNELEELPETIGQLTQLTEACFNNNSLERLPETIGQLTQLKVLYIHVNELEKLPETIGQLKALRRLDIDNTLIKEIADIVVRPTIFLTETKANTIMLC